MNKFKLPSGAMLRVHVAPFEDSKNLYQAVFKNITGLNFDPNAEMDVNFIKDILFTLLSSKEVEEALWKCIEKSLYNDLRITKDTFEEEEARQDYFEVMSQVAWQNINPFMKGLFAKFPAQATIFKEALKLK